MAATITPERAAGATPSVEATAPRPRLAGVRVLVVEDEADARDLLHLVLTEAGAVVDTAATVADAFAKLSAHPPHVVVSDIGMPDEDGYALMRRIRDSGDGVPTVALTAYTRPEDRTRALRMGFSAHVGKPVDPRELLDLVAALAGRPRP
jgi:CheY-like chemotaxis protein